MKCKICGSHAINHHLHARDGSKDDLCDVCYWRDKWHSMAEDYSDLIMCVGNKYKDESRHDTAKRYIKKCEGSVTTCGKALKGTE